MSLVVTDNFDRANAASLGANWSDPGSNWGILSNQASSQATGDTAEATTWSANSFGANQYSKATIKSLGLTAVVVRCSGTNAGGTLRLYRFTVSNSTTGTITRIDPSAGTVSLLSIPGTYAIGDVIYLEASGTAPTTLTAKLNGVQIGQVTNTPDAGLASGAVGFQVITPLTRAFDDWEGGDLPGLSDSLISFWELEEASGTRADAKGSNPLADNNTVTSAAAIVGTGAVTTAANLEYLSAASNASLQMGDIDFTIAGWFKVNINASSGLVTKDSDAPSSRDYTLDWESGSYRFYFNGGGTSIVTAAGSLSTFQFVVASHDASADLVKICVNDGLVQTHATGGEVPNVSSAAFQIGAREYSSSRIFADAVFDQIGLWKRVLRAAEITDLYNGGSGRAYSYISPGKRFFLVPG